MAQIILAEDEAIVAMATKMMLKNLSHQIVSNFSFAEDLVKDVNEKECDLILMDIKLKGAMDGIEAAEEIRKTKNTPILFITGNSDTKTKNRIAKISNSFILQKPVMIDDLRYALHKLLG